LIQTTASIRKCGGFCGTNKKQMTWTQTNTSDYSTKTEDMKHRILDGEVDEVRKQLDALEMDWNIEVVNIAPHGYNNLELIMVVKILRPKK